MNHTPPHSLDAEQALLGGLLIDSRQFVEVADKLQPEAFYDPRYRAIWEAFCALDAAGEPIDPVTLQTKVRPEVRETLSELFSSATSSANVEHYARIVRGEWIRRQQSEAGLDIHRKAQSCDDPDEVLEFAQKRVMEIGTAKQGGLTQVTAFLPGWVDALDTRAHSDSPIVGLPTGFADLDKRTAGLGDGDLIIVAGRPSMGKTTYAMNIAEATALRGETVAVFSMEMPAQQLISRMVSSVSRVALEKIRTGQLEDDEWPLIAHATQRINAAPLFIDDTPALSPADIKARARRLKQQHGLRLIVVDYLQLMQVPGFKKDNRQGEITEISRSLKALAKELSVPVIALSQLNRSLEQRANKRPVMSDLRESGAIEQDADVITFIYRDEVYHDDSPDKGTAEIIIGKQRNGPIGTDRLVFCGAISRFEDMDQASLARLHHARSRPQPQRDSRGFDA